MTLHPSQKKSKKKHMPHSIHRNSERKSVHTSTLGEGEWRSLLFREKSFNSGIKSGSAEQLSKHIENTEGLPRDCSSNSSQLASLPNFLWGVKYPSKEETDPVLLRCAPLIVLTLRNNSCPGLVSFLQRFCPATEDGDPMLGECPTSEFSICSTEGDTTSTFPLSNLQSLSWYSTCISTKYNMIKYYLGQYNKSKFKQKSKHKLSEVVKVLWSLLQNYTYLRVTLFIGIQYHHYSSIRNTTYLVCMRYPLQTNCTWQEAGACSHTYIAFLDLRDTILLQYHASGSSLKAIRI